MIEVVSDIPAHFGRRGPAMLGRDRRTAPISAAPAITWNPSMAANCVSWCRSDANTITLNGSHVSAWADKTGNSRGYTQAVAAKQPAYVSSGGINNLPYIHFSQGTSQLLRWLAQGLTGVQDVWMVFRSVWPGSQPGNPTHLWGGTNLTANVQAVASSSSSVTYRLFTNATNESQLTFTQGADTIIEGLLNSGTTSGTLYHDLTAGSVDSGDGSFYTFGTPLGCGDQTASSLCAEFYLYEAALYSQPLSSSDRTNNDQLYAQSYYGNTV